MVKKVFPWIVFVVLFGLIIVGFALKDNMNAYVSKIMQEQASPEITLSGNALVDSLYNYSENGLKYEITFLEFGAKGCSACKRMESVMEEIHAKYPAHVNIVFLNILKPESQNLMKLFGIAAIPTQVFLNNEAKDFFRHTGYISTAEIENTFQKIKI